MNLFLFQELGSKIILFKVFLYMVICIYFDCNYGYFKVLLNSFYMFDICMCFVNFLFYLVKNQNIVKKEFEYEYGREFCY